MTDTAFCQCPCCQTWFSRQQILESPEVQPIGMMLEEHDPHWNFFVFNHVAPQCGSTFAVSVEKFADLLDGPPPAAILTGHADCAGHCTSLEDLAACTATCHWAPYRRLLRSMLAVRGQTEPAAPLTEIRLPR